jgi:hypothetical protein
MDFLNKHQAPLLKCDPLHVSFRSTQTLGLLRAGFYDWTLQNAIVTASPRVDIDPQNLYAIEYFTFSADVEGSDFSAAIVPNSAPPGGTVGIPRLSLYLHTEKGANILKQPLPLPQFYQNAPFPRWRMLLKEHGEEGAADALSGLAGFPVMDLGAQGIKSTDQFDAGFEASLQQTAALVGKASITLILAFGLLEIKDENFIKAYRASGAGGK